MVRDLLVRLHMKIAAPLLFTALAALVGCNDDIDYSAKTAPIGACGAVETHVVGIYDSGGKVVEIKIDRPGKHNIVVSAHDATKWKISTTNGARVLQVYAVGYDNQLVAVPRGTKVIKDSFEETGVYACGFGLGADRGCDSEQLMTLASAMTHHVSSFHGCTTASSWRIGKDLGVTSNCAVETQYDTLAGCIAYMNGDSTCGSDPEDEGPGGPGVPDGGDPDPTPPGGNENPDNTNPDASPGDGSGPAGPVFL